MQHQFETIFSNAKRYFARYAHREAFSWYRFVRYYILLIPFIAIGILAIFIYIIPTTPKSAILAIGQTGSSYGVLANKFTPLFKEHNLTLHLIETGGLVEGLKVLDDPKSKVNASFMPAGAANGVEYPNLVSLGSIQYSPIWLFYRGKTVNVDEPFDYFANKKINIGTTDTASNMMFRLFLGASHHQPHDQIQPLELPHAEGAKLLINGEIDALFIVDSFNAPVVQQLLKDPNIKILSVKLADAYLKQFPFLEKLTIPKGAFDIENILPREDITLLGTTTNLLIEKDTSPAIQWAFMLAASELGKYSEDFFSKPGTFPRVVDLSFPISPIAKRFYAQGAPEIFEYLPIWIGSTIDHAWVLILAFIALIYPLYKWIIGIRAYPSKMFLYRRFINMRDLDELIDNIQTKEQAQNALHKVEYLINLNTHEWLNETEAKEYFSIKSTMLSMKSRVEKKLAEFADDKTIA